jgi:hypothetical protein
LYNLFNIDWEILGIARGGKEAWRESERTRTERKWWVLPAVGRWDGDAFLIFVGEESIFD